MPLTVEAVFENGVLKPTQPLPLKEHDHPGERLVGLAVGRHRQPLAPNPADVQKLTAFRQAIDRILHSSLQVLTIPSAMLGTAAALSQQIGLLTNDALIVAVMQAHGLSNLASNDTDFDRVPGITRYAPL
jgi:predicted nucleic acid-binding protein